MIFGVAFACWMASAFGGAAFFAYWLAGAALAFVLIGRAFTLSTELDDEQAWSSAYGSCVDLCGAIRSSHGEDGRGGLRPRVGCIVCTHRGSTEAPT